MKILGLLCAKLKIDKNGEVLFEIDYGGKFGYGEMRLSGELWWIKSKKCR